MSILDPLKDKLVLRDVQTLTRTIRAVGDKLKSERGERDFDDQMLDRIDGEMESAAIALREIAEFVTRIKQETGAARAKRHESREIELGTIGQVEQFTDTLADKGTKWANIVEYMLSRPGVMADMMSQYPEMGRVVNILADREEWAVLTAWWSLISEKLDTPGV